MNIAIFGGAFNPIHKAHTTLAENVLKECNVEKVIFIPTFISPHKSMQYAVPFEHRVNMCKIATKDNDNFIVSTLEENFKGKGYTYRTLEELKKLYPNDNLFLDCVRKKTGARKYIPSNFSKSAQYSTLSITILIYFFCKSTSISCLLNSSLFNL